MLFTTMDKQAINEDGEKTTSHPFVKLVRQYNTNFQQSESYQSLSQGSTMAFGLEEIQ
jgi:hypothetical protein